MNDASEEAGILQLAGLLRIVDVRRILRHSRTDNLHVLACDGGVAPPNDPSTLPPGSVTRKIADTLGILDHSSPALSFTGSSIAALRRLHDTMTGAENKRVLLKTGRSELFVLLQLGCVASLFASDYNVNSHLLSLSVAASDRRDCSALDDELSADAGEERSAVGSDIFGKLGGL
jgi:hypothetical protein